MVNGKLKWCAVVKRGKACLTVTQAGEGKAGTAAGGCSRRGSSESGLTVSHQ